MKLVTYLEKTRFTPGLVRDDAIIDLSPIAPDLLTLIDGGSEALARVREYAATAHATVPLAEAHLLAPIPTPRRNVICPVSYTHLDVYKRQAVVGAVDVVVHRLGDGHDGEALAVQPLSLKHI